MAGVVGARVLDELAGAEAGDQGARGEGDEQPEAGAPHDHLEGAAALIGDRGREQHDRVDDRCREHEGDAGGGVHAADDQTPRDRHAAALADGHRDSRQRDSGDLQREREAGDRGEPAVGDEDLDRGRHGGTEQDEGERFDGDRGADDEKRLKAVEFTDADDAPKGDRGDHEREAADRAGRWAPRAETPRADHAERQQPRQRDPQLLFGDVERLREQDRRHGRGDQQRAQRRARTAVEGTGDQREGQERRPAPQVKRQVCGRESAAAAPCRQPHIGRQHDHRPQRRDPRAKDPVAAAHQHRRCCHRPPPRRNPCHGATPRRASD